MPFCNDVQVFMNQSKAKRGSQDFVSLLRTRITKHVNPRSFKTPVSRYERMGVGDTIVMSKW